MSDSLKMVIVLTLIAIISGASLSFVDTATRSKIAENKTKALMDGMKTLLPEAENFKKIDFKSNGKIEGIYKAVKGDNTVGWGFMLSGPGFQDKITIVIATDPQIKTLLGLEVLEQKETPGLGAKMEHKEFKEQFKGKSLEKEIGYIKNSKPKEGENKVEALSAATISTKQLLKIINNNVKNIKEIEEIKQELGGK